MKLKSVLHRYVKDEAVASGMDHERAEIALARSGYASTPWLLVLVMITHLTGLVVAFGVCIALYMLPSRYNWFLRVGLMLAGFWMAEGVASLLLMRALGKSNAPR